MPGTPRELQLAAPLRMALAARLLQLDLHCSHISGAKLRRHIAPLLLTGPVTRAELAVLRSPALNALCPAGPEAVFHGEAQC